MAKTRIICTLGPASSSKTVVRDMMLSGMDVARLNFSHGTPQESRQRIDLVRTLNRECGRRVELLGDLQGHRIRIGELSEPVQLTKGETLWLTQEKVAAVGRVVPFDYQGSLNGIRNGNQVFIDDGNIALEVVGRCEHSLKTEVITGGVLRDHKGVNIPDAALQFGGMSQKDVQDIRFCQKNCIDYIAQSFVRTKSDILDVRDLLGAATQCRIIAKIECKEGIRNIDEIIQAADGIMIARGDMGVCVPIYQIPIIQKKIIRRCNRTGTFVITATQMLESMTENRRPTRAEVTDVANAILDGTDLVMLSAESAAGRYPVEAVTMMSNIIDYTETHYRQIDCRDCIL